MFEALLFYPLLFFNSAFVANVATLLSKSALFKSPAIADLSSHYFCFIFVLSVWPVNLL